MNFEQLSQYTAYFFVTMFLLYILNYFILNRPTYKIVNPIVDDSNDLTHYIDYFKVKHLELESQGEQALANPWDEYEPGIPRNEELEILSKEISKLGFKTSINKTFTREDVLHHFTVVWE